MKKSNSPLSLLLPLFVLFAFALGCNQSGSDSSTTGNAASTTSGNSANSPSSTSASTASADIAGKYDISGTNEGGAGAYQGTLVVTNRGDVHQFTWDTAGKKYDGVGVRTGNGVGVAFAEGDNGRGCGVVLYKIGADGSLDGKAGYWGTNTSETETATRTKGSDLDGEYSVKGKNTEGKDYSGTLTVAKSGAGYEFKWNTGSSLSGFGIRQGDTVAVGIGGQACGFVSYEVKSDGTLDGKWGGYGSRSVGTEVARKK